MLTILPDLLTVGEVANLLKLSTLTIRRWLKAGKIKGYRLPTNSNMGKLMRIRIPREEIDRYLEILNGKREFHKKYYREETTEEYLTKEL